MLTVILYALLAAFIALDAVAHFTHYRYGPTVSWTVLWLEHRFPIFHLIVGAIVLALGLHLEGAF